MHSRASSAAVGQVQILAPGAPRRYKNFARRRKNSRCGCSGSRACRAGCGSSGCRGGGGGGGGEGTGPGQRPRLPEGEVRRVAAHEGAPHALFSLATPLPPGCVVPSVLWDIAHRRSARHHRALVHLQPNCDIGMYRFCNVLIRPRHSHMPWDSYAKQHACKAVIFFVKGHQAGKCARGSV